MDRYFFFYFLPSFFFCAKRESSFMGFSFAYFFFFCSFRYFHILCHVLHNGRAFFIFLLIWSLVCFLFSNIPHIRRNVIWEFCIGIFFILGVNITQEVKRSNICCFSMHHCCWCQNAVCCYLHGSSPFAFYLAMIPVRCWGS